MTPEDQAYVDQHDLDRLIQAMMMAMLRSKPKDPVSFLIQKLSKQLKRREPRSAAGPSKTATGGHRRRSLLKKRPTGLTLDDDSDDGEMGGSHAVEADGFPHSHAVAQRSHQRTPVNASGTPPAMSLAEVLEEEEAPPVSSRGTAEAQLAGMAPAADEGSGADGARQTGPQPPHATMSAHHNAQDSPEEQQPGQMQQARGGGSASIASQALALLGEGDSETGSNHGGQAWGDEDDGSASDASDSDEDDATDPLNSSQYRGVHGRPRRGQPCSIIHCPSCGATINNTTGTPTVVAPKQGTASSMWTSAGHAFRFTQALRHSAALRRGGGGGGRRDVGQGTARLDPHLATLRLDEGQEDELGDGADAAGSHGSPALGALLTTRRQRSHGQKMGRSYQDPRKPRAAMTSDEDTTNEEDNDDFVEDSVFGGAEFDGTVKGASRRRVTSSGPRSARGSRPGSRTQGRPRKHMDLVSTWRSGANTPTNMLRSLGSVGHGDGEEEEDGTEDVMSVATGVDADDELEAFFRSH